MHERVRAASDMDGWVAVQLLREADDRGGGIVGTWQSREHWARWHDDETFKATRAELAGLEDGLSNTVLVRPGGCGDGGTDPSPAPFREKRPALGNWLRPGGRHFTASEQPRARRLR